MRIAATLIIDGDLGGLAWCARGSRKFYRADANHLNDFFTKLTPPTRSLEGDRSTKHLIVSDLPNSCPGSCFQDFSWISRLVICQIGCETAPGARQDRATAATSMRRLEHGLATWNGRGSPIRASACLAQAPSDAVCQPPSAVQTGSAERSRAGVEGCAGGGAEGAGGGGGGGGG